MGVARQHLRGCRPAPPRAPGRGQRRCRAAPDGLELGPGIRQLQRRAPQHLLGQLDAEVHAGDRGQPRQQQRGWTQRGQRALDQLADGARDAAVRRCPCHMLGPGGAQRPSANSGLPPLRAPQHRCQPCALHAGQRQRIHQLGQCLVAQRGQAPGSPRCGAGQRRQQGRARRPLGRRARGQQPGAGAAADQQLRAAAAAWPRRRNAGRRARCRRWWPAPGAPGRRRPAARPRGGGRRRQRLAGQLGQQRGQQLGRHRRQPRGSQASNAKGAIPAWHRAPGRRRGGRRPPAATAARRHRLQQP